ncbi:cell division protein DamX [Pseudoalteromonas sp. S327]|uniref:AAA family ATPase n=1 Tax=unclassified Pseudoalteromonas TaxID=194690 RepID=UPI00110A1543|nr:MULTISPECIES: AAA family ATPase [unclassified Pseudoalteromonas]TMO06563.1 cell division protein DamX [Pseudoalteromonas sp. S327]TMO19734.1 cell division protein DamX [Pseudoalteromonas sp. S326]
MQAQILPSRAALVDRIALQFEYGQNLIVLLGTSGLGKSYMLETFITDKYNSFNKAFVQVSASVNDVSLMSDILEQSFNSPLIDHDLSLSENFYQLLQQQPCEACLWVLDNARHLSEELLQELELLAKNSPVTLYIMLASQSKLAINNAVEIYLEPLSARESKQLMSWYFPNLPYDEDPVFSAFLNEAKGNPSLLLAWQPTEHVADIVKKDKLSWRVHLISLLMIIMLLIIGLLYKNDMTQWWQTYYQNQQSQDIDTAIPASKITATPSVDKEVSNDNSDISKADLPLEPVSDKSQGNVAPHKNDVPAIMQSLTREAQQSAQSEQSEKSEMLPQSVNTHEAIEPIESSDKESPQPTTSNNVSDNAWYLAQPDNNTTVQLLAVTQEKITREFIIQHNLSQRAKVYQTKRNNKVWWVVTIGSYASLADAKSALSALSSALRKNKPFYKKISKIKQEIARLDQ